MQDKYTNIFRRCGAAIIDSILVAIIIAIPLVLFSWVVRSVTGEQELPAVFKPLGMTFMVLAYFAYWVSMEGGKYQATYGKRRMNMYISRADGIRKVSYPILLVRFILMVFFNKLLVGVISIFTGLFTQKHQALHDMICNTVVLNGRPDSSTHDLD